MAATQKLEVMSKEEIKRPGMEEETKAPEKLVQLVVFTLGNEEYGVGILDVKEIVETGQITTVPNMPDFIRGVINLRGKIIVVIDLEKRFLLQREKGYTGKHILIALAEGNMFGLLVDEVTEVLRLPEKALKPAPNLIAEKIASKYLTAVGTVGDRLIIILDVGKVLAEEELVKLSEVSGKHYRKIKLEEKSTKIEDFRDAKNPKDFLAEEKVEEVKPPEKEEELVKLAEVSGKHYRKIKLEEKEKVEEVTPPPLEKGGKKPEKYVEKELTAGQVKELVGRFKLKEKVEEVTPPPEKGGKKPEKYVEKELTAGQVEELVRGFKLKEKRGRKKL